MGRVATLFGLVRAHAAQRFPWLGKVEVRFCVSADREHRKRWRQFAHTGHDPYTVCFARAAERELTDEEILGMSAHELGHVVGTRLRYPEHMKPGRGRGTPQRVQDEADWIARKLLGFPTLSYNRRTLEELRVQPVMIYENVGQPPFKQALRAFPKFLMSFDALSHKTTSDLVFLARHELDLYEEGEETDIRTPAELAKVRQFVRAYGGAGM